MLAVTAGTYLRSPKGNFSLGGYVSAGPDEQSKFNLIYRAF